MKMTRRLFFLGLMVLLIPFSLSGCNLYSLLYPEPTPVTPTQTPVPLPRELNICLGYEPRSLYPYQAGSQAAREVLRAIYEGPFDVRENGQKEAIILENMPDYSDGSAALSTVSIIGGNEVVNSAGDLVALAPGTRVFPAGCTSADCVEEWDGSSELQLNQLTVVYKLINGLKWSDGKALTASDSLYAYSVASDPATPVTKRAIDLTESYVALDDTTIEWIAKPGLITSAFDEFFWAPLPEHAWGDFSMEEMLTAEEVNRSPLGWGPYVMEKWEDGKFIRLKKNPHYFRAGEDLPAADILNFRFHSNGDPEKLLASAENKCDLVSSTALGLQDMQYLNEHVQDSSFHLEEIQPTEIEMLAFGIKPSSYDDYYYPYGVDRPNVLGDTRTRQAIAHCMDWNTLQNKLLSGSVEMANSLFDANHTLLKGLTLTGYSYDPTLGISLLEQVGWKDLDLNPDTPITAVSVTTVPAGTPFSLDLLTSESPLRGDIAAEITGGLKNCGIDVNVSQLPVAELYQPGPEGLIFGRQFDLALLSWQTDGTFNCNMFTTDEIPSEANYWLGEKTGGANVYGFSDTSYDEACSKNMQAGLDKEVFDHTAGEALTILNEQLPFVPLYLHPETVLLGKDVCGFNSQDLQKDNFLSEIEYLYTGESCAGG